MSSMSIAVLGTPDKWTVDLMHLIR